jgi:hypothetical protein
MRAAGRRATADGAEPAVEIGPWVVDLATHRVRPRDGTGPDLRLTPTTPAAWSPSTRC